MEESENNANHRGIKKGLYLIPTAFTAANIAMGFLAVIASLRGFQIVTVTPDQAAVYFDYAAKAIGLAILFDTLDGRLARMTKTATELGVQLDSLADVLTFGIAPVTLVYCWGIGATFSETSPLHKIGIFASFVYLMCGVIRLARFNLQATRPRVLREGSQKIDKKQFVGLPIPAAAGLIAAVIHFVPEPLIYFGQNPAKTYGTLVLMILPILGGLMVSTLRYSSFKNVGAGRRKLHLILVLGTLGMFIWLYSEYALLAISVAYVSHGLVWYLMRVFHLRKRVEVEASG